MLAAATDGGSAVSGVEDATLGLLFEDVVVPMLTSGHYSFWDADFGFRLGR